MADAVARQTGETLALLACPLEQEVDLGDPVRISVALLNLADTVSSVRPAFVFGAWLDARIEGPDGAVLERVAHVDAGPGSLVQLSPGGRYEEVVDLMCPMAGGECDPPYSFNSRGVYTIAMRYSYLCDHHPCERGRRVVDEISAPAFRIVLR
jgi:hypothetical protein